MTAVQAVPNATGKVTVASASQQWRRWQPLSGIAFVVFFVASTMVSNVPAATDSDQAWIAAYTGAAYQLEHLTTGILLVLAAISLMSFLTVLWTRIAAARRPESLHPLPLVAAGASAACIAAGGVLMATISGSLLAGGGPIPGADLIRFGNDTGFGMVALGGMLAAALSLVCLSVQARSVGLFGTVMFVFSLVVAAFLLGSLFFLPILALLIWVIVVAIVLIWRKPVTES
jgi:hypothetical protein